MRNTALHWLGRSFVVAAAAALSTACTDGASLAPDGRRAPLAEIATTSADAGDADRAVELGACDRLAAPEGSKLTLRLYARGVQIYRWNGASWDFVAPSATLFADAGESSVVGTHSAGPTWLSVSGSRVVGAVMDRCTADPNAIPWLLLSASSDGTGMFERVKYIQRLNTVGGKAPAAAGSFVGAEANVPYTAEYFFYQVP